MWHNKNIMTIAVVEKNSTSYDQLDFRHYYKREFNTHKETRLKLERALDRIDYLEKRLEKFEADNTYLKKLLFSKKTEKPKKKLKMRNPLMR